MSEVEQKIAESLVTLYRLLVPNANTIQESQEISDALDILKSSFTKSIGRRIIKGTL